MVAALASILVISCAKTESSSDSTPRSAGSCEAPVTIARLEPMAGSASRSRGENWEARADFDARLAPPSGDLTPRRSAVRFGERFDVEVIPEWTGSHDELTAAFEHARDARLYRDRERDLDRRATWLYPYDGCASRGAHVARTLESRGYRPPAKLYAFGNLRAKTPYQRGGTVFWWYHTAPAYRVGADVWVFDPSLEGERPLEVREWLSRMSKAPENVRVAVCDANAFNAQSVCRGGGADQDRDYASNIRSYLRLEWRNVETLGYDPSKLLGDEPPWAVDPTPVTSGVRCSPP